MRLSTFSFIFLFLALSEASTNRTLSVSGDCQRKVGQDRVGISITAEFLETNPSLASSKATQQYNQLRDKIKKLNLKDQEISTTEFSVFEEFEWIKNTQKSKGYRARQTLTLETSEMNKIGEALKIAQDLGVKRVSGLSTFVSEELRKSEREACLEEAFKNARSKADRIAKVSGVKIGSVLEMNETAKANAPEFPRFKGMMAQEAMVSSAAGTEPTIDAKSELIQSSLQVIFLLQ